MKGEKTLRSLFPAIVYGLISVLVIVLSFSLIISLLLTFTNLTENSFKWIIVTLSFLSLFIGGFIAGGKAKQKGWLSGLGTGLLFSIITFLIQYLGYNTVFTMEQYMYHGGYLLSAILGGMIGVNMTK